MELLLEKSDMKISHNSLKSPLRYPGGKSKIVKKFLKYIPKHKEYREIFAGGASLFFSKQKTDINWINDTHPGLHAFYVSLRDNYDKFVEMCLNQKGSLRDTFNYWVNRRDLMEIINEENIIERAVQFYFINRTVWGGRVVYDPRRKSRLYFSNPEGWNNIEQKIIRLKQISHKLKDVKISCINFNDCLENTNEDSFIYCDPPYFRDSICSPTDKLYDKTFTLKDHKLLANKLNNISAKIIISYDNCDYTYNLYNDKKWRFVELEWKYCGRHAVTKESKKNGVKEKKVLGKELLLLNY